MYKYSVKRKKIVFRLNGRTVPDRSILVFKCLIGDDPKSRRLFNVIALPYVVPVISDASKFGI